MKIFILTMIINLGILGVGITPRLAEDIPQITTSGWQLLSPNLSIPAPTLIAPENNIITADPIIEFIWEEVDGALNYQIQISQDWNFASILHTNTTLIPTYTYTVSRGQGYYWRVRAILPSDQTDWSEEWGLSCSLYDAPVLISPVEGISQTDSTMTFTWEAIPGAEQYIIEIALTPDGSGGVAGGASYTNTYTQYFLQPNVYYWRVVAFGPNVPNQWNWGVYSEYRQFTIAQATAYDAPELSFYYAFPNYATEDMSVVMVDIIPQGILLTIQFANNDMATALMVLEVDNRLMNIRLQNFTWLVGGSPTEVMLIYEQVPLMFLQTLLEVLPTDYLWLDSIDLTHYHLVVYYAFMP